MPNHRSTTYGPVARYGSVRRSRRRGALLGAAAGLATVSLLVGLLSVTLVPTALGWRSDVVLSGSMRPALEPGDVVLSAPVAGTVQVGDVVVVRDPARTGHTLVHRVDSVRPDGSLVTRGDANTTVDSTTVAPHEVLGQGRLRVPSVGLPSVWWQQGRLLPLAVAVLAVAAAAWGTVTATTAAIAVPQRGRRLVESRRAADPVACAGHCLP
jgi:signal peptidase